MNHDIWRLTDILKLSPIFWPSHYTWYHAISKNTFTATFSIFPDHFQMWKEISRIDFSSFSRLATTTKFSLCNNAIRRSRSHTYDRVKLLEESFVLKLGLCERMLRFWWRIAEPGATEEILWWAGCQQRGDWCCTGATAKHCHLEYHHHHHHYQLIITSLPVHSASEFFFPLVYVYVFVTFLLC